MLMKTNYNEISLIIFDLDGTLYDQRQLRLYMAMHMAKELPWSSRGRQAIRIIRYFRQIREELADTDAEDIINQQYSRVATELCVSEDEVIHVIDDWLLKRPLPVLQKCREPFIGQTFDYLRAFGKTIAVFSDYPAHGKLVALDLNADIVVAATDLEVNRFKPNPKGLNRVLQLANTPARKCIVIGDRADRDGECACRAGAPFLLKHRRFLGKPFFNNFEEFIDKLNGLPRNKQMNSVEVE